jgi:hypothetical protein
MIRKSIFAAVALLAIASYANATLIAEWTFETSLPATAGPHTAEGGVNGASSLALGLHTGPATYSSPAGNGSAHSFSANQWSVGDYYQFCTSTTGYSSMVISWDQTGSSTGPRDFALKLSSDGYSASALTYQVLLNGSPNPAWNGTTSSAVYHFSVAVSSLDNAASACVRMIDTSTTAINLGTVATAGTDRVDNVQFNGVVPEPGTVALLGLGVVGLIRRRR